MKCYCGNPLTAPPKTSGAKYAGPKWPEFKPINITVVQTATVVIDIFTLVDPTTGDAFGRRAGPGADDGPAPEPSEEGEGSDETTTTLPPIPTNANYDITIAGSGGGPCQPFSTTSTASVANGQVTIQANQPLTGPLNPDGTFVIDAAIGGSTTHVEGRLDDQSFTATANEVIAAAGSNCTFTINGTRSG